MYKRSRSRPKRIGQFVAIFFILVLLGIGFYFLKNREYFANAWGGKGRLTILLYSSTSDSQLISLDPYDESLTAVLIPGELYVDVPGGYGSYRLSSVYNLGELDKKGGRLVSETVSEVFGIPVFGVIIIDKPLNADLKSTRSFISGLNFLKMGFSSFGMDILRFWWQARGIKANKVAAIILRDTDILSDLLLSDNSKALKYDSVVLDNKVVARNLTDGLMASEKFKIEVLNSTEISGLGEKAARFLVNMGLSVLSVNNSSESVSRCKVKSEKKVRNSYTVVRLLRNFGCSYEEAPAGSLERTDLTITLGSDFANSIIKN